MPSYRPQLNPIEMYVKLKLLIKKNKIYLNEVELV